MKFFIFKNEPAPATIYQIIKKRLLTLNSQEIKHWVIQPISGSGEIKAIIAPQDDDITMVEELPSLDPISNVDPSAIQTLLEAEKAGNVEFMQDKCLHVKTHPHFFEGITNLIKNNIQNNEKIGNPIVKFDGQHIFIKWVDLYPIK